LDPARPGGLCLAVAANNKQMMRGLFSRFDPPPVARFKMKTLRGGDGPLDG
jgi:hypothetical protein